MSGMLTALQKAFAYRLKPTQFVGWIDAVSRRLDNNPVEAQAILSVHDMAGTPTIVSVASNIPGLVPGSFTVVDNGTGDASITWPVGTFRVATADPEAIITGNPATFSGAAAGEKIANGIRVRTVGFAAATPHDANYNIHIYGQ